MDSGLGTYVTYNPASVNPETAIDDLLRMVEGLAMHDFPVVDGDQKLAGGVWESDLLRLAQDRRLCEETGAMPPEVKVAEVVSSDLVTVDQSTSPRQALKLLIENHIHALPVLQLGRLVGIVSSSDFLREFSYGQMTCAKEPVSDFLSKPAEPLEPDATVEAALKALDQAQLDFQAVVQGGCPVGIVSRREIQKLMSLSGGQTSW